MGDDDLILLIILAAVAGFLLLRLRNVLGERTGFEDPDRFRPPASQQPVDESNEDRGVVTPFPRRGDLEPDPDVFAYAEPNSDLGKALLVMKANDPNFSVAAFMDGAKGAYEMLLKAFEDGDKETLKPFLDDNVFTAFSEAIDDRGEAGLSVDMRFIGFKSAEPIEASFDPDTKRAEISVRYAAEVVTATRNAQGDVVEGDPSAVRRINDVWTYARTLGDPSPNWILVATGG